MAHALHLPQLPRRSPLLGFIILMHAVAIYYINDGLQIGPITLPPPDMSWVDIAPESKPVKPEPVVKPDPSTEKTPVPDTPELPPIQMSEPEPIQVATDSSADPGGDAITPDTSPSVDPRHPLGKPEYPARSIRAGEEGLVVVNACVQPDGRLADVHLARSSGFAALDTAAVNHLARPAARMRPATANGRPTAQCVGVPIRFDLKNR